MKIKPSVDYHKYLIERLRDPAEALAYLKAALEERDLPEVFLLALRNVAEARGFGKLAQDAKLNRESLYRMLSRKGNPSLVSLHSLLDSLGFRLSVEKKSSRPQKPLRRTQRRQLPRTGSPRLGSGIPADSHEHGPAVLRRIATYAGKGLRQHRRHPVLCRQAAD